jgi:hypothetical protein
MRTCIRDPRVLATVGLASLKGNKSAAVPHFQELRLEKGMYDGHKGIAVVTSNAKLHHVFNVHHLQQSCCRLTQ